MVLWLYHHVSRIERAEDAFRFFLEHVGIRLGRPGKENHSLLFFVVYEWSIQWIPGKSEHTQVSRFQDFPVMLYLVYSHISERYSLKCFCLLARVSFCSPSPLSVQDALMMTDRFSRSRPTRHFLTVFFLPSLFSHLYRDRCHRSIPRTSSLLTQRRRKQTSHLRAYAWYFDRVNTPKKKYRMRPKHNIDRCICRW